jgi:2-polyprenyl-3-methyl-5-hydroxy-6-metoxy-1,4-benzoquinol methylase
MNESISPLLEAHNRGQRAYFDARVKRTMVPRRSRYVERQIDELVRHAGLTRNQRLLEVGCGMGRYTLPLAERGFSVEGLDLTPGLLEKLDAFNGGRFPIPLHAADVADPPPALVGAFDAIVGFFALHHMHDLDACYAGMARMVRPGGSVTFVEPNPFNPSYYAQILLSPSIRWRAERGLLKMRRETIFGAMAAAGLETMRLARFGLFPPVLADRAWTRPIEAGMEAALSPTPCLAFQIFSARRPATSKSAC